MPLDLVSDHCGFSLHEKADTYVREAQFGGTILFINYAPSDALCLIQKNIIQEWRGEYHKRENYHGNKTTVFFYKIHPFLTFESLPDGKFKTWKSKTDNRLMGNHTYDIVYLNRLLIRFFCQRIRHEGN